jgi:hypothetical protein
VSTAARGLERFQALPRYRRWAALASLVWVVVVTSYAIGFFGGDAAASRGTVFIDGLFFLIALMLPLMLVWLAAWLAEELERQREVIAALAELTPPLIEAMAATRATLERHAPASPETIEAAVRQGIAATSAASREIDPRPALANLAANQARMEGALRELLGRAPPAAALPEPPAPETVAPRSRKVTQRRRADDVPRPVPEPAAEPTLPLLPEGEPDLRPSWPDLVRALNFPRDDRDTEGFRALKSALRHHSLAQMLQAAEDVLTMLSQHGIYMDDLEPAERDPEAWRRFIAGTRGAAVDAVGAIRDPRALEVARGLMKSDPIFRDTALFFHRRFDGVLGEFASEAEDDRLLELADTRSGRAFMLLARLNGAFG